MAIDKNGNIIRSKAYVKRPSDKQNPSMLSNPMEELLRGDLKKDSLPFDLNVQALKSKGDILGPVNNREKEKSHEDDILNAINNREKAKSHKSEPMNR